MFNRNRVRSTRGISAWGFPTSLLVLLGVGVCAVVASPQQKPPQEDEVAGTSGHVLRYSTAPNANPYSNVISGSFTGQQNHDLPLSATLRSTKDIPLAGRTLQFRFRWRNNVPHRYGVWDATASGVTNAGGVASASIRIPKNTLAKKENVEQGTVQVWFDGDNQPVNGLQYRGSYKNVTLTVNR